MAAQPGGKGSLLLDVTLPPGRPGLDSPAAQVVGTVQQQVTDVSDPRAAGEPVEVVGDERAEQHGRRAALRNAVGNSKPGLPEGRPRDRPPRAERTGRIQQPVNVERDTPARQQPRQWREDRRLTRPRSPGDDKQRLDRRVAVKAPAVGAPGGTPAGLHHHWYWA